MAIGLFGYLSQQHMVSHTPNYSKINMLQSGFLGNKFRIILIIIIENSRALKENCLVQPKTSTHVEMFDGNPEEIADQLVITCV